MHEGSGESEAALAERFASRFSPRHPAVRATMWHIVGYLASQTLRFGSNLILARLLVPEDFGLMLLVNLVLHGLEMFSDVGFGPALIHHRRGGEPAFLRTAWTLGLVRGAVLWAIAALLAWPLAALYGEPRLIAILPVAGFSLLLDAGCSSYVAVLERRLEFGRLMVIDLCSYAAAVAVMITGALFTSTVWPLVAGLIVNAGLSSALTHTLRGATPMRLCIDPEAARHLMTFGRWLFLSSMLTFIAGQLDRLLLGGMLTVAELGVYSIAFMMAQATVALVHELARRMLHPVYARVGELGGQALRAQVRRYRLALLLLTTPPLLLLYTAGPEIIRLLYDHRYWDAGWMLQILSVGALLSALIIPAESVLVGRGDAYRHMLLQGIGAVVMTASMCTGYYLGGTPGLLVGYALSGLPLYPFLATFIQRHGVWLPGFDLGAIAVLGGLIAGAAILREYLHLTVI